LQNLQFDFEIADLIEESEGGEYEHEDLFINDIHLEKDRVVVSLSFILSNQRQ
jgi:hypothetical protein